MAEMYGMLGSPNGMSGYATDPVNPNYSSGMTEEERAQLNKNTAAISSLNEEIANHERRIDVLEKTTPSGGSGECVSQRMADSLWDLIKIMGFIKEDAYEEANEFLEAWGIDDVVNPPEVGGAITFSYIGGAGETQATISDGKFVFPSDFGIKPQGDTSVNDRGYYIYYKSDKSVKKDMICKLSCTDLKQIDIYPFVLDNDLNVIALQTSNFSSYGNSNHVGDLDAYFNWADSGLQEHCVGVLNQNPYFTIPSDGYLYIIVRCSKTYNASGTAYNAKNFTEEIVYNNKLTITAENE